MSDLEAFFIERKVELNSFNTFLISVENNPTCSSQLPIFKSQVILMLYNLVEGTVNKAITTIFDTVSDANLKQTDLSDHLQKIWLKHLLLNIDDSGQHESRITNVNKFVNDNVIIELDEFRQNNKSYFGAGSLDSKKIKGIFKKFSIDISVAEFKLQEIKTERNFLAHGEKSFTEIGQNKTVSELAVNTQKVINYLENFIQEVLSYLQEERFKRAGII